MWRWGGSSLALPSSSFSCQTKAFCLGGDKTLLLTVEQTTDQALSTLGEAGLPRTLPHLLIFPKFGAVQEVVVETCAFSKSEESASDLGAGLLSHHHFLLAMLACRWAPPSLLSGLLQTWFSTSCCPLLFHQFITPGLLQKLLTVPFPPALPTHSALHHHHHTCMSSSWPPLTIFSWLGRVALCVKQVIRCISSTPY